MRTLGTGGGWLFAVVLLLTSAAACAPAQEPPTDPELREALGLGDRVRIHRVDLTSLGAENRVLPSRLEVGDGAVVQFVTLDRRLHQVRFLFDSLSPAAARFLEQTGQGESPPLVRQGSRFVLSFDGAPAGAYPFMVEGHGDPVSGIITVLSP